jgi:4-amino-4-deoxy-L-arabinose transferase-like glycosyltransferase
LLILLFYLIVGTLFAVNTPDWEAPDEPAHYNYVRQLAEWRLPVIEPGDYDQEYLVEVVFESHFAPQHSLEPLEYEDWQPPLYYLLLMPLFWLSGGSLLTLRLFSMLLGAGVVVLTHEVARRVFADRYWVTLTATVFVAFLPQHVAILSSVNNDSLAELLIAAILLTLIIRFDKQSEPSSNAIGKQQPLALGFLLGLGFLTKGTVYPMAIMVALVLMRYYWREWQGLARTALAVFMPAILLGSAWWARNIVVYGGLDILGRTAHDAVVTGQPLTADLVTSVGLTEAVRRFLQTTFNSFWGQFGWMTMPLPGWVYRWLWVFSGVVILGLLFVLRRRRTVAKPDPTTPLLILSGAFLLTVGVHVGYNFTFEQHQGRYLFPALIPIGIGVALGLEGWMRLFQRKWSSIVYLIPAGLAVGLISLDLWSLYKVIVPAFN